MTISSRANARAAFESLCISQPCTASVMFDVLADLHHAPDVHFHFAGFVLMNTRISITYDSTNKYQLAADYQLSAEMSSKLLVSMSDVSLRAWLHHAVQCFGSSAPDVIREVLSLIDNKHASRIALFWIEQSNQMSFELRISPFVEVCALLFQALSLFLDLASAASESISFTEKACVYALANRLSWSAVRVGLECCVKYDATSTAFNSESASLLALWLHAAGPDALSSLPAPITSFASRLFQQLARRQVGLPASVPADTLQSHECEPLVSLCRQWLKHLNMHHSARSSKALPFNSSTTASQLCDYLFASEAADAVDAATCLQRPTSNTFDLLRFLCAISSLPVDSSPSTFPLAPLTHISLPLPLGSHRLTVQFDGSRAVLQLSRQHVKWTSILLQQYIRHSPSLSIGEIASDFLRDVFSLETLSDVSTDLTLADSGWPDFILQHQQWFPVPVILCVRSAMQILSQRRRLDLPSIEGWWKLAQILLNSADSVEIGKLLARDSSDLNQMCDPFALSTLLPSVAAEISQSLISQFNSVVVQDLNSTVLSQPIVEISRIGVLAPLAVLRHSISSCLSMQDSDECGPLSWQILASSCPNLLNSLFVLVLRSHILPSELETSKVLSEQVPLSSIADLQRHMTDARLASIESLCRRWASHSLVPVQSLVDMIKWVALPILTVADWKLPKNIMQWLFLCSLNILKALDLPRIQDPVVTEVVQRLSAWVDSNQVNLRAILFRPEDDCFSAGFDRLLAVDIVDRMHDLIGSMQASKPVGISRDIQLLPLNDALVSMSSKLQFEASRINSWVSLCEMASSSSRSATLVAEFIHSQSLTSGAVPTKLHSAVALVMSDCPGTLRVRRLLLEFLPQSLVLYANQRNLLSHWTAGESSSMAWQQMHRVTPSLHLLCVRSILASARAALHRLIIVRRRWPDKHSALMTIAAIANDLTQQCAAVLFDIWSGALSVDGSDFARLSPLIVLLVDGASCILNQLVEVCSARPHALVNLLRGLLDAIKRDGRADDAVQLAFRHVESCLDGIRDAGIRSELQSLWWL